LKFALLRDVLPSAIVCPSVPFNLKLLETPPVPRQNYRIGVPRPGHYREALNSDASAYGGSNLGNAGGVMAEPVPWHGRGHSIVLTLPPLGGVILVAED
jgi:1,4-alpha-glucan branching enzyme